MAKTIKECRVELRVIDNVVKAYYFGDVGSSDDASLSKKCFNEITLAEAQTKADDLMALAEAAMNSDEDIS